jgi:nucleoside-diphosphate-sugar epimerase
MRHIRKGDGAMNKTALVVGARGGIGGEMVQALRRHGWQVKALARNAAAGRRDGVEWIAGDALRADDVRRAAAGVSVIVHAVNPPGYRDWDKLVLPMLDHGIAAARAAGARLLLPGTVYNYGPDAFPLLREDAPQHALTRKGAIRVEMERRLREATRDGAMRAVVVRAGDFFGPQPGNNWLSQGVLQYGSASCRIVNPAAPGAGHAWAYLPDVAETMVRLLQQEQRLAPFENFHFEGFWDADGNQLAEAIRRVLGRELPLRRFPWKLLPLLAPFNTTLREMREMRYLWRQPVRLDNSRLKAFLGAEPRTPLDEALRQAIAGLDRTRGAQSSTYPAPVS